jgi:hypothetical protein
MRRNALITFLFAAAALGVDFATAPASAAEGGASTALDQSVTIATVALPLVFDGQIVNYVFVSVKLLLTPSADSLALRDKEPYFRDALVRAAHRTPFVRAGDYNHLDDGKLKAALYRDAVAITGPGKIAGVVVLTETPEHRRAMPSRSEGAPIEP